MPRKSEPAAKPASITPTQMRLDDTTKAEIEAIGKHFGVTTTTGVVRFMARRLYQEIMKKGKPS